MTKRLSFRGQRPRNLLLLLTLTALFFGTVSCKKSAGLSGAGPSSIGGSSGGTSSATNASGASIGTVFGGLSPINGATVGLYQAGTNTAIATTTTNAQGGFNLPFNGAAGLLYIVATGGNPNGSGTNSSIQMIGLVGSSSALPTSAIQVNELTTAAFMTVAKNMGLVNDSNGTVTFKAPNNTATLNNTVTQINNFISAGQLNTGNSNFIAASQESLSTIANAVATCVEGGSSGCSTFIGAATNPSTGANSSNILDAVNNMLGTTSMSTISNIYALAQKTAPSTGFALTSGVPSSLIARFANSTNGPFPTGGGPSGIAQDSSGNIWVANSTTGQNSIMKFDTSGTLLGTFSVGNRPSFMSIDASGNLWFDNYLSAAVQEMNSSGTVLGTFHAGTNPVGVAIDASGSVWAANHGSNNASLFNNSGALLGTFTTGTGPWGLAIDSLRDVWVANFGASTVTELNSAGTTLGTFTVGSAPYAIQIDLSGNIWVTNDGSNTVTELSSSGTTLGTFVVGTTPVGIAIDSVGNVFVACSISNNSNAVVELNSSGVVLGNYPVKGIAGLLIDASGNVWATNQGGYNTITELVGVAAAPQFFPYSGPQFSHSL